MPASTSLPTDASAADALLADASPSVLAGSQPRPLDAGLGLLLGEVVELKRVRSARTHGRSFADVGFRRAWNALVAGADADATAAAEVAFAAAHVALGPVDSAALANAGVAPDDRRAIYRRAAARWLGPLDEATGAALDGIADDAAPPGPAPLFVERLCARPRAAVLGARHALPLPPDETYAEHCWSTAVIAGLVARTRGSAPGDPVLIGLAHHLADQGPEGASDLALPECPPALAARIRSLVAAKDDVATAAGFAFTVGNVVDRVLQQRTFANLAGFSLSDALDLHELVRPGPLRAFEYDALTALGLAF